MELLHLGPGVSTRVGAVYTLFGMCLSQPDAQPTPIRLRPVDLRAMQRLQAHTDVHLPTAGRDEPLTDLALVLSLLRQRGLLCFAMTLLPNMHGVGQQSRVVSLGGLVPNLKHSHNDSIHPSLAPVASASQLLSLLHEAGGGDVRVPAAGAGSGAGAGAGSGAGAAGAAPSAREYVAPLRALSSIVPSLSQGDAREGATQQQRVHEKLTQAMAALRGLQLDGLPLPVPVPDGRLSPRAASVPSDASDDEMAQLPPPPLPSATTEGEDGSPSDSGVAPNIWAEEPAASAAPDAAEVITRHRGVAVSAPPAPTPRQPARGGTAATRRPRTARRRQPRAPSPLAVASTERGQASAASAALAASAASGSSSSTPLRPAPTTSRQPRAAPRQRGRSTAPRDRTRRPRRQRAVPDAAPATVGRRMAAAAPAPATSATTAVADPTPATAVPRTPTTAAGLSGTAPATATAEAVQLGSPQSAGTVKKKRARSSKKAKHSRKTKARRKRLGGSSGVVAALSEDAALLAQLQAATAQAEQELQQ